jgi:hypothetical protein
VFNEQVAHIEIGKGFQVTKIFPTLPNNLEQFNPELLPQRPENDGRTFDEDGKLHSYDDKPIFISSGKIQLSWYSHGKKHREGNKPVSITFDADLDEYITYDENDKAHSYNGMPSSISYDRQLNSLDLTWHNHGLIHRDNDQPASIWSSPYEYSEEYYQNDFLHRDNSLPAVVQKKSKRWFVYDLLHNSEGVANIMSESTRYPNGIAEGGLYGVVLPEEKFYEIKAFSKENNVPLWLPFFLTLGIVDAENVNMLRDSDTGKLDISLPIKWYIHLWGITDELFYLKLEKLDNIYFYSRLNSSKPLFNLLKIVQHEEANISTKSL